MGVGEGKERRSYEGQSRKTRRRYGWVEQERAKSRGNGGVGVMLAF